VSYSRWQVNEQKQKGEEQFSW